MKAIPNKATGDSPIPAYMHPDTARLLLVLSQLLNTLRGIKRAQVRREGGTRGI